MDVNEYLDTLSEQIRCKKARPLVVEEIRNHIEDQAQAYRKDGMEEEAALSKAVIDMGDPVQAGAALDKVHRPKMQWSLVFMVILLCLFGMIMQIVIFQADAETPDNYIFHSVLYSMISIAVMIAVCMLDYTFLNRHPIALWCFLCFFKLFITIFFDGGIFWLSYSGSYRENYITSTLLIPIYAAVVFRCRNHKMAGLFQCIAYALLWLICSNGKGVSGVSALVEYSISVLIILTFAILKGWFVPSADVPAADNHNKQPKQPFIPLKKGLQLALLWLPSILLPAYFIISALCFGESAPFLASYQVNRIKAMFGLLDNAETTVNYVVFTIRDILSGISFLGGGSLPFNNLPSAVNFQNDYIITGMFTYFGAGITAFILIIVAAFLYKAFHISFRQKNQMGAIISIGCTTALFLKSIIYLCSNLGMMVPFAQMSMPFLSYGLSNAITNAVLVGLLLSVFRNTDIVSEKPPRPKYIFRMPIQKME